MNTPRKAYPSDVSDPEWEFLLPYLTLMRPDAPQRAYDLREVYNALRYIVKTGCQWRMLPNDLLPWTVVYQQARRWLEAGVFETIAHDLRVILRLVTEREAQPTATILDSRTLQSAPESGGRAGYDGAKRKNGSKVHVAVDTMGSLLALKVTAANEQERAQVGELAERLQELTGGRVEVSYVDHGYTGANPAQAALASGIKLVVIKRPEANRGFVLLPRRWVVERTFGWLGRFRRLARDYERLPAVLGGWHWVAFVALIIRQVGFQS